MLLFFVFYLSLNVGNFNLNGKNAKEKQERNYTAIREKFDIPQTVNESEIDSFISISKRTKVPIHMALNIIQIESKFDSTAVNDSSGCIGYMQLSPKYFKKQKNRFENVYMGLSFLRERYEALGSWKRAIAYFGGGGGASHDTPIIKHIVNNGSRIKF